MPLDEEIEVPRKVQKRKKFQRNNFQKTREEQSSTPKREVQRTTQKTTEGKIPKSNENVKDKLKNHRDCRELPRQSYVKPGTIIVGGEEGRAGHPNPDRLLWLTKGGGL